MSQGTEAGTVASVETNASNGTGHVTVRRFTPYDIPGKPWGIERVVAQTDTYVGKLLMMKSGCSGALQHHQYKNETFHLYSGIAMVRYRTEDGLVTVEMNAGESYHVPPGAVHQVEAVTDCVFFEASTPVFDDRVIDGTPV